MTLSKRKKKLMEFCHDVVICMGNSIDKKKCEKYHWNQEQDFLTAFNMIFDVWVRNRKIKGDFE